MEESKDNFNMKEKLKEFGSAINEIRNILRTVGVTDKDSLNHCILFACFRMTSVTLCKKFKISEEYAFENFEKNPEDEKVPLDDEELRNKFYNPGSKDCYVYNYRTNLGMSNFKFNDTIKNRQFREIYFKLKEIPLSELNNCIDIIGYIYEDHLRTGARGKTGRDLGQYFTHREVIRFMLKLADPKLRKDGCIETIVDPTMGTAGFLSTAVEYLNKKYKKIEWKNNSKRLFGFDIAKDVAELGHLNLILTLKEKCENICSESQDTLCDDMIIESAPVTADVILANEPMGLKGFKHAQFCERIKNMKIYGTKVEPAFVQLFMQALNDKGRCVVIVPDGFLFQNGKQFVETRRKLLEEFEVKEVIKLNDKKFFTNTGVKASIIFFVKSGKQNDTVKFSEISLDRNEELVQKELLEVKTAEILENETCNLNYSLYLKTEEIVDTQDNFILLKDVCTFKNGKQLSKKNFVDGQIPVIGGGKQPVGYHNKSNTVKNTILIASSGSAGYISKYDTDVWASDCFAVIPDETQLLNNFLFYYLKSRQDDIYKKQTGTAQPHVYSKDIENMKIPIIPLEKQKELVEKLDVIYENNNLCERSIKNFKSKLTIALENKFSESTEFKSITELFTHKAGKFTSKQQLQEGKFPFYSSKAEGHTGYLNEYCFDSKEPYIIMTKDGGAGQGKYGDHIGLGTVFLCTGKTAATSHQIAFFPKENNKVLTKYIYLYLKTIKSKIMDMANYTTGLGTIKITEIQNIKIPIFEQETQEEIIKFAEKKSQLISILEKEIIENKDLTATTMGDALNSQEIPIEDADDNIEEDESIRSENLSDDEAL